MTEWALPIEGGCRCGRVRFRVTAPPMITMACHCTGCQRMSGSAFSTTAMVPADAFEVTQGDPVPGGMHDAVVRHQHCDGCKAWVFTRIEGRPFVNVRGGAMDHPGRFAPFVDSYLSEAMPWARTGAVHGFEQFPNPDRYGELLAEFAALP